MPVMWDDVLAFLLLGKGMTTDRGNDAQRMRRSNRDALKETAESQKIQNAKPHEHKHTVSPDCGPDACFPNQNQTNITKGRATQC